MYLSKLIFTTSFFFLLGLSHLAAQTTTVIVSGTVIDQEDKPLPFANVILLDINSQDLITGTITDEAGSFSLQSSSTKELHLKVSSIGHESFSSKGFYLGTTDKKFGLIKLNAEMGALDAVEVRAARPNVLIQADKTERTGRLHLPPFPTRKIEI